MKQLLEKFNILPIWPVLTWRMCSKCSHQFRREAGWSYATNWQGREHKRYVCSNCCPSPDHVQRFFTNFDNYKPPVEE